MGSRLINVVQPDGTVVAVPEDVAQRAQAETATPEHEAAIGTLNEERSAGIVEGVKAAGEGALDAATLGAYGAVREAVDPEGARNVRIRAEERPGARMLGEIATVLARR